MKKGKKLLLYGLAALMAFQMPAISASAAQTGEIAQETVEAQTYEAVTATSGDFGVNNGLHWEYDTETKTVTVSGEDVPNVTGGYDENYNHFNNVFPAETEKVQFDHCRITSNMSCFFEGLGQLKEVDFSGLTTSDLTNMRMMFYDCSSLVSLDMSGFDTCNVTNMCAMFSRCYNLVNLDVRGLNTGNVTDMSFMFQSCYSLEKVDLSGFDTSKVTTMNTMFEGCQGLKDLDLSGFNTGNVTDMSFMFVGCWGLSSLDLSSFDTSNVTNMSYMIHSCKNLISLDLSNFDTGNVTDMFNMFLDCDSLTTIITPAKMGEVTANLPAIFTTEDGTTTPVLSKNFVGTTLCRQKPATSGDFGVNNGLHWEYDTETKTVTVSGEDVANVTSTYDGNYNLVNQVFPAETEKFQFSSCKITSSMSQFFAGLHKLTEIDFSGLKTSSLSNISSMFEGCRSLTNLDLTGFDTSHVTNMSYMFVDCRSLVSLNVREFDTSNVTNMKGAFWGCFCLEDLDLCGFDTNNVTDMSYMFYACGKLTTLDLNKFETSNVTKMRYMFTGCQSLTSLDLSGFDTSSVTDISHMFEGCTSLIRLDLSGFDTVNVTNMDDMFDSCNALTTLATPSKMGDVTADLPATFYTADGTATTVLSKDFVGTTLYKEGHVPQPATPLAITTQPVSAEAKDGSQATFTVSATGDGLTYQWQLCYAGDDTFRTCTFPGADTATLTVDATKARNGYSFRCVITDEHGSSVTSDVATLTVKTDVALGVALTASKTTADSGEIVTFTAVGNGGDGNYQYKFIINDTTNDKWYKLQDYSANNTIEWKATTAGTKRIMVDIKDGTGKSVGKNVSVVVNGAVAPTELKGTLTASSYEVNPGDVVTLTAQALGGSGKYNYKFIINDKTDDKWYRLQDYGTNSVIQWTATTPGTKRLMVDVMDSDGRKFGTNVTITVK